MINYRAIKNNSRLVEFEGIKELVIRNTISNMAKVPNILDKQYRLDAHAQTTLGQF